MATSGSTSFNLNIDEVIDEGYERCGLRPMAGYDLKTARRSFFLKQKSENCKFNKDFDNMMHTEGPP